MLKPRDFPGGRLRWMTWQSAPLGTELLERAEREVRAGRERGRVGVRQGGREGWRGERDEGKRGRKGGMGSEVGEWDGSRGVERKGVT